MMRKQIIKIRCCAVPETQTAALGSLYHSNNHRNELGSWLQGEENEKQASSAGSTVAIINLKGEGEQAWEPATHPQHPCKKLGVPARTCNPRAGQADMSGSLALTGQSLKPHHSPGPGERRWLKEQVETEWGKHRISTFTAHTHTHP